MNEEILKDILFALKIIQLSLLIIAIMIPIKR